ncbi:MAG: hypothetical protein ABIK98_11975 [Pseudomonadota bacterium]|uniref:Uncharacterized protein n=1 Tax=Candidatus Desulfatibia profunda TaxID=2841695 RepID=A0A8J6NWA5_9BACT|nr:hypothetical protein [Candidatus Desulfatibia profunda]MBL7179807.1 hypothetical protein [Desulfobacterales bacterium]
MLADIRDKSHISHNDLVGLNFIKNQGAYVFRKYYKQGLRSQIMEVLDSSDVLKQNRGEIINGIRHFPRARPIKMLRIFRTKFESLEDIFAEIEKYKIIEKYLPPSSYSKSCEFIVDYAREGQHDFILCGLQDYVEGKVLNPWDLIYKNLLANLVNSMQDQGRNPLKMTTEQLIQRVREQANHFIESLKKMILEANYVPDLAGFGNLILTPAGDIKLVDINNISKVSFGSAINLDDRGYPVCDKSIEAIAIMEQKLLGRTVDKAESLYQVFLTPQRIKKVKRLEENFHHSLKLSAFYPK